MPMTQNGSGDSVAKLAISSSLNKDGTPTNFGSCVEDSASTISNEDLEDLSPLVGRDKPVKSNSMAIIFSLWSVMIGSTVLMMPSMARQTGIYASLFGTFFMCCLNSYTAVIMEKLGTYYQADCPKVVNQLTGKIGYYLTTPPSVLIFFGAMIIYQDYICDAVMTLAGVSTSDKKYHFIFAFGIGGFQFVVGLLKSITPLVRLASYMIIVVTFLMFFIIIKSGLNIHDDSCKVENKHQEAHGLGWYGAGPLINILSAMSLSLFCHNMVSSITNEATVKANVTRDVVIAFFCTAISNIGPAVLAVYAFRFCDAIPEDFPDFFHDPFTTAARVAVTILVSVVFPILLFNTRSQALQSILGEEYPYIAHVIFNAICLAGTSAAVAFNLNITMIAALAGGCAIVFTLLMPTYMWYVHNKREFPEKITLTFKVVNGAIFVFGIALMILTIMSESGVPL